MTPSSNNWKLPVEHTNFCVNSKKLACFFIWNSGANLVFRKKLWKNQKYFALGNNSGVNAVHLEKLPALVTSSFKRAWFNRCQRGRFRRETYWKIFLIGTQRHFFSKLAWNSRLCFKKFTENFRFAKNRCILDCGKIILAFSGHPWKDQQLFFGNDTGSFDCWESRMFLQR